MHVLCSHCTLYRAAQVLVDVQQLNREKNPVMLKLQRSVKKENRTKNLSH